MRVADVASFMRLASEGLHGHPTQRMRLSNESCNAAIAVSDGLHKFAVWHLLDDPATLDHHESVLSHWLWQLVVSQQGSDLSWPRERRHLKRGDWLLIPSELDCDVRGA